MSIFVGSRVITTSNKKGLVRFIGKTKFAEGEWYGLQLDTPDGKNDGSISNIRYFDCEPQYGLFCKASQIRIDEEFALLFKNREEQTNTPHNNQNEHKTAEIFASQDELILSLRNQIEELNDNIEMLTLDKEQVSMEYELLEETLNELKKSREEDLLRKCSSTADVMPAELQVAAEENRKLREALYRLNEISKTNHEQLEQARVRELDAEEAATLSAEEVSLLQGELDERQREVLELRGQVQELLGAVDTTGDFENMIERLTEQNLTLIQRVKVLEQTVLDLETELELMEEIDAGQREDLGVLRREAERAGVGEAADEQGQREIRQQLEEARGSLERYQRAREEQRAEEAQLRLALAECEAEREQQTAALAQRGRELADLRGREAALAQRLQEARRAAVVAEHWQLQTRISATRLGAMFGEAPLCAAEMEAAREESRLLSHAALAGRLCRRLVLDRLAGGTAVDPSFLLRLACLLWLAAVRRLAHPSTVARDSALAPLLHFLDELAQRISFEAADTTRAPPADFMATFTAAGDFSDSSSDQGTALVCCAGAESLVPSAAVLKAVAAFESGLWHEESDRTFCLSFHQDCPAFDRCAASQSEAAGSAVLSDSSLLFYQQLSVQLSYYRHGALLRLAQAPEAAGPLLGELRRVAMLQRAVEEVLRKPQPLAVRSAGLDALIAARNGLRRAADSPPTAESPLRTAIDACEQFLAGHATASRAEDSAASFDILTNYTALLAALAGPGQPLTDRPQAVSPLGTAALTGHWQRRADRVATVLATYRAAADQLPAAEQRVEAAEGALLLKEAALRSALLRCEEAERVAGRPAEEAPRPDESEVRAATQELQTAKKQVQVLTEALEALERSQEAAAKENRQLKLAATTRLQQPAADGASAPQRLDLAAAQGRLLASWRGLATTRLLGSLRPLQPPTVEEQPVAAKTVYSDVRLLRASLRVPRLGQAGGRWEPRPERWPAGLQQACGGAARMKAGFIDDCRRKLLVA